MSLMKIKKKHRNVLTKNSECDNILYVAERKELKNKMKKLLTSRERSDRIKKSLAAIKYGEVSEWFKELVLKTSDSERDRGFESHLLRLLQKNIVTHLVCLEKYPSG